MLRCIIRIVLSLGQLAVSLVAKISNNLEGISLIDEILLMLRIVKHFLSTIAADKRIEKGFKRRSICSITSGERFWAQDATQTLRFLWRRRDPK